MRRPSAQESVSVATCCNGIATSCDGTWFGSKLSVFLSTTFGRMERNPITPLAPIQLIALSRFCGLPGGCSEGIKAQNCVLISWRNFQPSKSGCTSPRWGAPKIGLTYQFLSVCKFVIFVLLGTNWNEKNEFNENSYCNEICSFCGKSGVLSVRNIRNA